MTEPARDTILRRVKSDAPVLTVIMPVLNESRTIATIIERVQAVSVSKEIIVVDDGSTDGTTEIIKSMSCDNVRLIEHDRNRGKGSAIRTAIPFIRGKYTVIQDGDLEYDPQDFLTMLETMEKTNGQVVYGSRILSHSPMSYLRFWLGGRGVTFFTNLCFGSKLSDEPTCYKMFRSDLLPRLQLESVGFEFCPEVTAKVLRMGIPIHEVPISYNPRSLEEGKKIRWKDGLIAVWVLVRNRFRKNYLDE